MQTYIVLIACVILLLCLFFRVPVYISVFAAALTYFLFQTGSSPAIIAQRIGGGIQSIPLLAIPFFICAGIFMNSSGVTKRIMNFCNVVTKRMTGGLGQVNVLLSTLMGGLSGSNLADAAMEAKILVPEMEKKRILQRIFFCINSNVRNDYTVDSTGNWNDFIWFHRQRIYRKVICRRNWNRCFIMYQFDDHGTFYL